MWEEVTRIRANEGSLLSHGEKLMMLIAVDMWNGGAHVSIYEMWSHLSPETVHDIADAIKLCLPLPS